jgi:hypothetical protein
MNVRGAKGISLSSASNIDIGGQIGDYFLITGTTTINTFSFSRAGTIILKFAASLTLTHSASLSLISSANIITSAGDIAVFRSEEDGNWTMVDYTRKNADLNSDNYKKVVANYSVLVTDGLIDVYGGSTFDLPLALNHFKEFYIKNNYTSDITITVNGSDTIEKTTSYILSAGDGIPVKSDGVSNYIIK